MGPGAQGERALRLRAAFHSCEFWSAVGDEAFGGWNNVDVDKMAAYRPYLKRYRYMPHYALVAKTGIRSRQMNACSKSAVLSSNGSTERYRGSRAPE